VRTGSATEALLSEVTYDLDRGPLAPFALVPRRSHPRLQEARRSRCLPSIGGHLAFNPEMTSLHFYLARAPSSNKSLRRRAPQKSIDPLLPSLPKRPLRDPRQRFSISHIPVRPSQSALTYNAFQRVPYLPGGCKQGAPSRSLR